VKTVELAAGTLGYKEAGTGPTILFVHGPLIVLGGVGQRQATAFRTGGAGIAQDIISARCRFAVRPPHVSGELPGHAESVTSATV
jgi:hypothetical protein